MTVSVQLTPWALPAVLAVLVVLRDLVYLGPRRRERSVPALLGVAGLSGLWAAMHLLAVVSTGEAAKLNLARAAYVPAMLAPVALLVFALLQMRRRDDLIRWPVLFVYVITVAGLVLTFRSDAFAWLVSGSEMVGRGDFVDLAITLGPAHWVVLAVRGAVGIAAAWILLTSPRGGGQAVRGRGLVITAALLVVVPGALDMGGEVTGFWASLSPVGFALACAALSQGLLRPRLLGLGPVARTLVMDKLRDPIVVLDRQGHIVDVNRAAERTLGVRAFGNVPLALGTLWASSRREPKDAPSVTLPVRGGGDEEEERTFDVTVTHLEKGGAPGRSALLLRDVTELREATRALELQANTDHLTGLANRRHFMATLEREMERSTRYARPLSLIILDLDHFKKVNDTHGHAAGDGVLRATAAVLRAACRDVDLAARLGGEELALLLPETSSEGAHILAERVREEIEIGRHLSPEGVPFRVTASLGLASAHGAEQTAEALMQASDKALYDAKDGGRNRVALAP